MVKGAFIPDEIEVDVDSVRGAKRKSSFRLSVEGLENVDLNDIGRSLSDIDVQMSENDEPAWYDTERRYSDVSDAWRLSSFSGSKLSKKKSMLRLVSL